LDVPKTFRPFQKGRSVANELKFVVMVAISDVCNAKKNQQAQNKLMAKLKRKFTGPKSYIVNLKFTNHTISSTSTPINPLFRRT
jgi:GTP cyclohydrolase III